MTNRDDMLITRGRGNVFADTGLPEPGELLVKAELTRQLYHRIKALKLTQTEAAKRLDLKQPDVSRLMNGHFGGFSTDRLIALLNALDIDVDIVLKPGASEAGHRGSVRVLEGGV
jgi:predicted XRE-type DNA-binding protein